jgi:hypothetical protein
MKFTILFWDGSAIDDETTGAQDIAQIADLLKAKALGRRRETVGVAGGWAKTVGDIRSIKIEAVWP